MIKKLRQKFKYLDNKMSFQKDFYRSKYEKLFWKLGVQL